MFNYRIISLVIILLSYLPSFSQKDTTQYYNKTLKKNNFSIELGGAAAFYSLGYERSILIRKKMIVVTKINIGYFPFTDFDGITVPLGLNVLAGENKNKFVIGIQETNAIDFTPFPKTRKERQQYRASVEYGYGYYSPPFKLYYIVPTLGYRRYFKKGNSMSFEFSPLFYKYWGKINFTPWFSINFNVTF